MKKSILILAALCCCAIGEAQSFVVNSITYVVTSTTNNTVRTNDYDPGAGSVVNIPASVTNPATNIAYSVTEIGTNSFVQNNLTSVTIPTSVTSIGAFAFGNNFNLSSVLLHNGITSIGQNAFRSCALTSVNIPTSMTVIEESCFGNNNLMTINIPSSIVTIGDYAFSVNNISDVTIGSSVTSIGVGAFSVNPLSVITSYALNAPVINTVTNQNDTFYNNGNRGTVNLIIPNNRTSSYATSASALWTGFKMVFEISPTSANEVKIADYNIANGLNLTIPSSVSSVAQTYSVTKIGNEAFMGDGLTGVTIPNTITEIGISSFNTNNLTNVTIPDSVTIINSQAFVTNAINDLSLGDNVSTIGLGAFAANQLTTLTIPSSVTNIGLLAFASNLLTDVTSLATTPPIVTTGTNDTFDTRGNIHLHIPAGTSAAYVTNAGALWINFSPVTEDALSTSSFELDNDIIVYTTAHFINIQSTNQARLENYKLYNMAGAVVATGNENSIATAGLSRGIYILKMDFDKGKVVRKVAVY